MLRIEEACVELTAASASSARRYDPPPLFSHSFPLAGFPCIDVSRAGLQQGIEGQVGGHVGGWAGGQVAGCFRGFECMYVCMNVWVGARKRAGPCLRGYVVICVRMYVCVCASAREGVNV